MNGKRTANKALMPRTRQVGFHAPETARLGSANDGNGASRAVLAAKPEGPLWPQRVDIRRNAHQGARRADSRPSCPRPGTGKFDPFETFMTDTVGDGACPFGGIACRGAPTKPECRSCGG
jgi:hypothetical protein